MLLKDASACFQVSQEEMGVVKSYNLKPGGDKIPVTKHNRKGESAQWARCRTHTFTHLLVIGSLRGAVWAGLYAEASHTSHRLWFQMMSPAHWQQSYLYYIH